MTPKQIGFLAISVNALFVGFGVAIWCKNGFSWMPLMLLTLFGWNLISWSWQVWRRNYE